MIRTGRAALALFGLVAAALAGDATVELGDARVRYDDARWKALPSEGTVRFEPQGEAMRRLDAVELHVADGAASCAHLAAAAFAIGHYDLTALVSAPWSIGGVQGERFSAHTRCRNATPEGAVACVRVSGRSYLLRAVNLGCEGRNLFSGIDPLSEIAAGLSFADRP